MSTIQALAVKCTAIALAWAAIALPGSALAQAFPTKPVRMVVPFPPGGATDIIGRMVAAKMQEIWGQTVIIALSSTSTIPPSKRDEMISGRWTQRSPISCPSATDL